MFLRKIGMSNIIKSLELKPTSTQHSSTLNIYRPLIASHRNFSGTKNNMDFKSISPPPSISEIPKFYKIIEKMGMLSFAAMTFGTLWLLKEYGLKNREEKIIGTYIDLSKDKHHGLIVSSDMFTVAGPKPKGELQGAVLKSKKSGSFYLKKGAQSLYSLVAEFLISDFLALARPGEQPKSVIMEEKQEDGSVRFFTLSKMHKNTMDLEDFITKVNWQEKLKNKPLIGLEVALVSDLMFAKQRDMKFANYLVTETDDSFIVTAIDHEFAGNGFLAKQLYLSDPNKIIHYIRDLQSPDEELNAGTLAGDPRAHEFMKYVISKQFMQEENILNFYKKVIAINPRNVQQLLHAIDGENGIIKNKQYIDFEKMIFNVQNGAKNFLLSHAQKINHDHDVSTKKIR